VSENSDKVFSFKTQLEVGDRAEQLFLEYYPKKLKIYPGREWDFTEVYSKKSVELKTDTYNMDKTDNFFMERYSDMHRETPGGPWRAKQDDVDIFCYYFSRHNTWFQFNNIPKLVRKIDKIILQQKLRPIYIKNQGWITSGYKINRSELDELYDIYQFDTE